MEIVELESTSSTNNYLKELAEKSAPHFTVVTAKTQSDGRGRYDRVWESPPGNLYLSILLRDAKPALSLIAGIAVAKTLEQFGFSPKLKWPNDVLVEGKKIAGILVESETGLQNYSVLGIGLNVKSAPDYATSMSGKAPLKEVRDALLKSFKLAYDKGLSKDEWMKYAAFLDEDIEVKGGNQRISGVFKGITESGEMILEVKGKTEIIPASEICS